MVGVSIVICCYNSAQRLPPTLAHLAAQKITSELAWEVIIVDNASTDNTAEVARTSWSSELSAPLRIVHEAQQGLSFARIRGFVEAKYDLISFVDDDNWVCPDWMQTVAEIMSQHHHVGACGGCSKAVSDVALPWWFESHQHTYAVGEQTNEVGDITHTRGFLWGAGITIRKEAWQQLLDRGFQPILTGRKGAALTAGEDYELCLALRLSGWHLWYDPRLQFSHFIPASRLQWDYVRRVKRGFGAGSVGLDAYDFALKNPSGIKQHLQQSWLLRLTISLLKLLSYSYKLILSLFNTFEGDTSILEIEIIKGRLSELFRGYKLYNNNLQILKNASWRT